ncbi:MAG TPA: MBL fold metallo-hydrolase [Chitinophagaceae bacterium]|jgi:L-ascorbate metabolism protein UlaG (beta-lactamase superfamily)|nr:MBL fold metallo-hydrolase [Chitinophagaceae bacterium]
MSLKIGGKLPSGKLLDRLKQSPNYKAKGFQNLSETKMLADDASYWNMICDYFKKNKNTAPPGPLPFVKTDLDHLPGKEPLIVWFGHSSYLLRIENKNILVDPVFSGNAAPVSFMVKAFPGSNNYSVKDMPPIDYLIITHDHYDHLDFKTVFQLRDKVKQVYCSLGVSSHLQYWGYDEAMITELDWWQSKSIADNMVLTAAPARHFSGRGLKRNQTLWSSFILKTSLYNIYLGGDSGYDSHFKTIGEKLGPFDLAILETGQYNKQWPHIHMMPEQAVQAAVDLGAKKMLPVHWAKFTLAMHEWNEPVKRVLAKAKELKMPVLTPQIGEPVSLADGYESKEWWVY